jgi:hypothetical protein
LLDNILAGSLNEKRGGDFLHVTVGKRREATMVSKLSKRIDEFELRLRQLESSNPDISYKAILELTSLVHELSQKIDHQQEAATLKG